MYRGRWELEVNCNFKALHFFIQCICRNWLGKGKTREPACLASVAAGTSQGQGLVSDRAVVQSPRKMTPQENKG